MKGSWFHRIARWGVVLWLACGVVPSAKAGETGSLRILVVGDVGQSISGVRVGVIGETLFGGRADYFTDGLGEKQVNEWPVGTYDIEVFAKGYDPKYIKGIEVKPQRLTKVRVELLAKHIGGAPELPIPSGRTYNSAVNIVAGVQLGVPGNSGGTAGRAEGPRPAAVAPPKARLRRSAEACNPREPQPWWVSPDDSNSMSAPGQVRAHADTLHWALPGLADRQWEFFNYAQWDYPPAKEGLVGIEADLAAASEAGEWTLQVAVTSPQVRRADRQPMNLTFVLDTSGSMSGWPIALTQQVLRDVSSQLRHGDIVNVVSWNLDQTVLLEGLKVKGPRDPRFEFAIGQLRTGGGTNLFQGLKAGYELARQCAGAGRIDRVVLVSDGGVNVGETNEALIGQAAGGEDEEGIYLIGVGIGVSYRDNVMDRVTDLGRGATVYIHDEAESARMFGQRFLETVSVAARDVKIRYDLPAGLTVDVESFSGEEISTDADDVRPQHLAPNDAMVLHQRLKACGPVDLNALFGVTVTYRDAVTFAPRSVTRVWPLRKLLRRRAPQLDKGIALMAFLESLRRLDDPEPRRRAEKAMRHAFATNPQDSDLAWMKDVLHRLP
ncbi:MAG: VWA domain-containing protein [Myxococcota bacterium]